MRKLLLVLIYTIFIPAQLYGQEPMRSAQMNISVPPITWKGIRLKNLPAHAVVAVEASADNPIQISLMNQFDYDRFPSSPSRLFTGDVMGKLSFTVTIPSTGDYYIVLDNGKGIKEVEAALRISAGRGNLDLADQNIDSDLSSDAAPTGIRLSKINDELAKIFIFEPFSVTVKKCGKPEAYSKSGSIVLCQEYIAKLQNSLNDKEKTAQVLLFVVFHEVGHILLQQWGYPFYDNEGIADEFATVMLIMVGKRQQLKTTAKYFAANTAVSELLGKAFIDDRHPLSIQRARNIVNWVNDRQRIERWQKIFVPHLQTSVLQRWQQEGRDDSILQLIEEELGKRENKLQ